MKLFPYNIELTHWTDLPPPVTNCHNLCYFPIILILPSYPENRSGYDLSQISRY